jgi:hypothetical protein
MQAHTTRSTPSTWTPAHTVSLALMLATLFLIEAFLPSPLKRERWLLILGLLTLFTVVAGQGVTGVWLGVLIDGNNKVSLSRLQMLLWTVMILSSFLAAVLTNLVASHPDPLAITIPAELWLLMGISTTSLVSAPILQNAKKAQPASEDERESTLRQLARQAVDLSKVAIHGHLIVNQSPEVARWSDLFQSWETGNVGRLDLGKVQMCLFTLILVLAYGASLATLFGSAAEKITALPTMDAGMLALLGISHAGYLVSQAVPRTYGHNGRSALSR